MTRAQLALIHVARQKLRLGEDDYRALLRRCAGVESAAELDAGGFERVMDEFARLGFSSDKRVRRRALGARPGFASPAQLSLLWRLWEQWSQERTDAALNKWLESSYGVSAARFLTADAASKAINGLRAMCRRKDAAEGGARKAASRARKKG